MWVSLDPRCDYNTMTETSSQSKHPNYNSLHSAGAGYVLGMDGFSHSSSSQIPVRKLALGFPFTDEDTKTQKANELSSYPASRWQS